jgi:hypothetical protein
MKNLFYYLGFFTMCLFVGVLVIVTAFDPSNAKFLALIGAFFCLVFFMFVVLNDKTPN